jgi:nitroreductase
MDAFLAVTSKREVRHYDPRPLDEDSRRRILDAGRVAGSAGNRQNRRFVVLGDHDAAADAVYAPDNLRGATLVIAIVVAGKGPLGFDAGRAAQNMMLAAWNEGIGSCPNGVSDPERMRDVVGHAPDEQVATVLSFGYPGRSPNPERRSAEEWIARANRRPFDEAVERR